MAGILKCNTSASVMIAEFVDDTDGKGAEGGLSLTPSLVFLSKNGGAYTAKSESSTEVSDPNLVGWYRCSLDATDTNTLGMLQLAVHVAGALPVWDSWMIVPFTYDWEYWIRPDEKYLYVSPSCERVTGYRQDEFMQDSMLLEKIAHPDDLAALQRHFKQDLECNEPLFLDFRITTKSGAQRWISHMCQQVRSRDGRPLGRRASNRDITERKKSEERQAELIAALEAANRELDEFAHVVSHDLKAPLRAINNLATWLIADLGDTLDSRGKERLDMLSHKAKHLHSH